MVGENVFFKTTQLIKVELYLLPDKYNLPNQFLI